MNTQSNTVPESRVGAQTMPALPATQPLYWSVRRELWEYRSIYLAPIGVAVVFLFGFLISAIGLPHKVRTLSGMDPAQLHEALAHPYDLAGAFIMGASFLVALFYCVDALHGERRDRSILFWKSLPVSDLTAVLAKASIPIVVLQLITAAVTIATQYIMLLLSSAVLLASGQSAAPLWKQLGVPQMSLMLAYHLISVHALWYAPIYCWLLLVSAWARRVPFLWAVLPPLAIAVAEKIAFNTQHFAKFLGYRFSGPEAFSFPGSIPTMDPMTTLAPGRFLATPGLWIGLGFAALFLAAAVRLRRNRGPI